MTKVVGLDLSLTSTGMAYASVDGAEVLITTEAAKSSARKDPSLEDRGRRLWRLTDKIILPVAGFGPDVVLIEGPAHNQKSGQHHDRSGLWWMVVRELINSGIPCREISPSTIKKYATGSGNAGKLDVVIAATRRYAYVDFVTDDEADALVLAALGCRLQGSPVEPSLPKTHLEALKPLSKTWEVPVG